MYVELNAADASFLVGVLLTVISLIFLLAALGLFDGSDPSGLDPAMQKKLNQEIEEAKRKENAK